MKLTHMLPADNVDTLLLKIFGTDEEQMATKHMPQAPKSQAKKTFATYSQLMTLAHSFNRKHGHIATKGCKCHSCETKRAMH